jgi:hypothetical protein
MKMITALAVAVLANMPCYAASDTNELTGVYHKAVSKDPAYLQIDGAGFIPRLKVSGEPLKGIPDGTRIWIKGEIRTHLYGQPDEKDQSDQQAPTQWMIVFHVKEYVVITKPFERPKEKDVQNQPSDRTR